jgi:uncharacterized protein
MSAGSSSRHFILSVGTQVVCRVPVRGPDGRAVHPAGAVGVVVQAPADHQHSYRVRFLDHFEAPFHRRELAILREFRGDTEGLPHQLDEYDLYPHVIYRCVVGSRAYGLDSADSDYDRRGVYLPPAELHWSLFGVPEQLENLETEEVYWELQKFLVLALKANPNVLECLYSPVVEHATELAQEMLSLRERFLSKRVYQTYSGYVASQFKKLAQDLRNKGQVKRKHVMHLIRLLFSGITILREGYVPVRVVEHRDELLAIRDGLMKWDEVEAWRLALHKEFDAAYENTPLPDRPDYARVNELLVKARRGAVSYGH